MKIRIKFLISFFVMILAATSTLAFMPPNFTSTVVDEAHVLSPADIENLKATIEKVAGRSQIFSSIAIVKTLQGATIQQAAADTFHVWQLGKGSKDNGLLILVALDEHQIHIEVGLGLKNRLTDKESERVVETVLKPAFQSERYADGLAATLLALQEIALQPVKFEWIWIAYAIGALVLLYAAYQVASARKSKPTQVNKKI